ncbi:hypothetical protein KFB45_25690, partial [Klebsiella pneumoniae]|uniref:hypothetical protein n=1 Tax=Klebsiella pneumoniae TaxID=573 RepID=UPI001CBC7155
SGSRDRHPPPGGHETQDMPHCQLRFIQYVVFHSLIVSWHSGAENCHMIIFPPWYTSGNSP